MTYEPNRPHRIRIKRFGQVREQDGEIIFDGFQFHESAFDTTYDLVQYDNICNAVIDRIRKAQDVARRLNMLSELQAKLNTIQGAINEAKQDNVI